MAPRVSKVVRLVNRTATQNLDAFVEAARISPAFGNVKFDEAIWTISTADPTRPRGPIEGTLAFTVSPTARKFRSGEPVAMAEPFGSFLKALVRLEEQARHTGVSGPCRTISSARMLYAASAHLDHDPRLISGATFSKAAALIVDAQTRGEYTAQTAYRMGTVLEKIARIMTEAGISERRIAFSNPISRPREVRPVDGEDPRLPADAALQALFAASNTVTESEDLLLIRLVELLTCAPWRINEVLRLPVDCEVHEPKYENGLAAIDEQGQPVQRYGLRYSGSKGFLADIKWIPTAMISVAKRAIAEIREITAVSREIAIWNEDNPGRTWLQAPHRGRELDRLMTGAELKVALGIDPNLQTSEVAQYCRIEPTILSPRRWSYRQSAVESAMIGLRRPLTSEDMPLSAYLFIIPRNFFNPGRFTLWPVIENVGHDQVSKFITKPNKSIFARLNLRDAEGRPYALRTHQLRHLLNTMAAENGLGEVERARWSGRADIAQNATYDHETGYQLAEKARTMLEQGRMAGPIAITFERLPPVDRKAFSLVHLATVHTTDIGMCLHDWGTAPCPHHGACATCRDSAILKGDPIHRHRIETLLGEEEATLRRALAEVEDGTYGASNFVEHHRRMADGYRQMLAIHDDLSIEDGTLVQLDPESARQGLLEEAELMA